MMPASDDGPATLTRAESEVVLRSMKLWERPTAEQVRNVVLEGRVLSPAKPENPRVGWVSDITEAVQDSVKRGMLFDLGYMRNDVLIDESARAVPLIAHGHIGHPFRTPYILFHTWSDPKLNDGGKTVGSLYFVDPSDWHAISEGKFNPGTFMVVELQCMEALAQRWLMVADFAIACVEYNDEQKISYHGNVMRGALHEDMPAEFQMTDMQVICNLFDPVTACLLLLATDGVQVDRIAAPEKLNKHRVKAGKAPIPAHWRVHTGPYITALMQRGQRRPEAAGGHHASPVPHLRRGHIRRLHERHGSGTVWVRDALVNLRDPDAPLARSFYSMQQETQR